MTTLLKNVWKECIKDIRNQYRYPQKSVIGNFFSKYWSWSNRLLVQATVNQLAIKPDDFVLEVGYGRGNGIEKVLETVGKGDGTIFGLEISPYMSKLVQARFNLEILEDKNVVLDEVIKDFILLQYPDNFFDGIFHVDVFYFWSKQKMFDICDEMYRILKPGKKMICGMDINRLKKFEKWQILESHETDPLKYLEYLEPVGFTNVRGLETTSEDFREFQFIVAEKPALRDEQMNDPEIIMKRLENEIKNERFNQYLIELLPQSTKLKEEFVESVETTKEKE